jgi:hypothetical protein
VKHTRAARGGGHGEEDLGRRIVLFQRNCARAAFIGSAPAAQGHAPSENLFRAKLTRQAGNRFPNRVRSPRRVPTLACAPAYARLRARLVPTSPKRLPWRRREARGRCSTLPRVEASTQQCLIFPRPNSNGHGLCFLQRWY